MIVTLEVEAEEHFGRVTYHIRSKHHHSLISCAAATAGRELMEVIWEHCLVDGFALDAESD